MTALRLSEVTLRYHDSARPALDAVSFEAGPGRLHWLCGPLGAGCTSLLMAAAGLAPRYTGGELTGRVELLGVDPQADGAAARLAGRVAFVTATPALQLSGIAETVLEEVSFAPANLGWDAARIRMQAGAALERFGVAELADRDPRRLSGGETQRVVLAAMLALGPDVWLLDEAGSALDPAGRQLLVDVVAEERHRGALVVTASEDVDAMVGVADRLVVLGDGRIVADGRPGDVLEREAAWTTGIGSTGTAELARAAGLGEPFPLTVAEGVSRWTR